MTAVDPLLAEIERLRIRSGLSVLALEQAANLGHGTYRAVRKQGSCTLYTLRALCDVLGLKILLVERPSVTGVQRAYAEVFEERYAAGRPAA